MTCLRIIAIVTMTVLSLPARAAVAPIGGGDNQNAQGDFNVSQLAFDGTIAAGEDRFLLLAVTTPDGAPPVREASYDGVPLAFVAGVTAPMARCRVELWGLVAPAVGTHTVRVTLDATVQHLSAAFLAYRGVSPARPLGFVAAATGSTGPSSVTVTGASPGDLVVDGTCAWAQGRVLERAGPGQVARWHWSTGALSSAGSELPGAPSVDLTWTASGLGDFQWGAVGLALRAADGTAGRYPARVDLEVGSAGCAVGHGGSRGVAAVPGAILMVGLALLARARRSAGTKHGQSR